MAAGFAPQQHSHRAVGLVLQNSEGADAHGLPGVLGLVLLLVGVRVLVVRVTAGLEFQRLRANFIYDDLVLLARAAFG